MFVIFFDYMDMHRCFLLKNWLTIIFLSLSADTILLAQDNVVREDTLGEVTVMSISAQRRLEEVQVAVEKIDMGTMAKVPSIFGERHLMGRPEEVMDATDYQPPFNGK